MKYLVKNKKCGYGGKPVSYTCNVEMKEFNSLEEARKYAKTKMPSEVYEEAGKNIPDIVNPQTGNKFKLKQVF